jgi:hypothetical protein
MKVIVYTATLPRKLLSEPQSGNQKIVTLKNFAQGVLAAGDDGIVSNEMVYEPSDVAVMLGWVHEHGKIAPHLKFREQILNQQSKSGGRVVIADSNLFLYKDVTNPHNYLRYSFDGVFPNTGEYCDANPDPERWKAIQRDMGVALRDWRVNGDHVLLCLQRDGGWSMNNFSVADWALSTVKYLRKHTDRPLRIRPHPGDKGASGYCQTLMRDLNKHGITNVTLSEPGIEFTRDLKHCWAVVNYNSSPTVGAAIEGVPIFVTDPHRSQAKQVANFRLSDIETPKTFDRLPWIQRISQFHWSNDDLISGRCWSHMRNWVKP